MLVEGAPDGATAAGAPRRLTPRPGVSGRPPATPDSDSDHIISYCIILYCCSVAY